MDDLIRRSDAIEALEKKIVEDTIIYQKKIPNTEEVSLLASEIFTNIPAVEPNLLIVPETIEHGCETYIGENIVVVHHDDFIDMKCKAMMWDEYGKEQKHGQWIRDICKYDRAYHYKCSICGEWNGFNVEGWNWKPDFCPHCGAKMKGADDEQSDN